MDLSNGYFVINYINQFERPSRPGGGDYYLKWIVKFYAENGLVYEQDKLLTMICNKTGKKRANILYKIGRFIKTGWKNGSKWEWENLVGWNQDYPPTPCVAIRWLCEHYESFVDNYRDCIDNSTQFYFRDYLKERETR